MKKLIALSLLTLSAGAVFADNLFQTNNPFPETSPQTMNNIYESTPSTIMHEEKQAKKSWFRKGKKLEKQDKQYKDYVMPNSKIINEGAQDNGFYVFK